MLLRTLLISRRHASCYDPDRITGLHHVLSGNPLRAGHRDLHHIGLKAEFVEYIHRLMKRLQKDRGYTDPNPCTHPRNISYDPGKIPAAATDKDLIGCGESTLTRLSFPGILWIRAFPEHFRKTPPVRLPGRPADSTRKASGDWHK